MAQELVAMVRALIQPLGATPDSSGARADGHAAIRPASACSVIGRFPAAAASRSRKGALRPGFGLLAAAAASLSLWGGIVWLVVRVLT